MLYNRFRFILETIFSSKEGTKFYSETAVWVPHLLPNDRHSECPMTFLTVPRDEDNTRSFVYIP